MVPSNLLGLLLFVVLLWPGFVYTTIRARRMPERQTTALRETVSIVLISLTALAAVLALFGLVRVIWPHRTPSVRSLIFAPGTYLRAYYVSVAWWGIAMLTVAVGGAAVVAALLTSTRVARVPVVGKLAVPHPSTMSAWWLAFNEWDPEEVDIHVGCVLDDDSYVSGRLHSYSQTAADVADRELLLAAPIHVRSKGGNAAVEIPNAGLVAVSARHLVTMTVSYVPRAAAAPAPPAPAAPAPPASPGA
jgi:hypothetical protein